MNKDIMKAAGFAKEIEAVENNLCPFCRKKIDIDEFDGPASRKEYEISGLCQECQNEMF